MKLTKVELCVIAAIVVYLGFLLRPAHVSPEPEKESRAVWRKQLDEVRAGRSTVIVMPDLQLSSVHLPDLGTVADKVTELNLSGDQLGQQIAAITGCSHLRILHLRTVVGDDEIAALGQLRELEVLDLPLATGVTDAGLKALEGHPRLRLIRLRAPQVTDAGLASLPRLLELRWLHLMEVPLTDAGLETFRSMPKLESLYLDGDRATDDGLSALITARPDLHFHRDQVHLPTDPRQRDGHRD